MRIFVTALFVASSIAVGIAQGEPGAPQGQQPGVQAPQPGAPAGQPPAAPREQPAPKPQAAQSKTTITGCIQNAPAAAAGGGAPAGAAASAQAKFVLANAKPVGGAAGGAVGTAGTAATRYQLEGDEKTISTHVNHQVEISGTVQPAAGGAAAGGAAAAPMFKVESVKMLADKCS